jgi:hypothetical protein
MGKNLIQATNAVDAEQSSQHPSVQASTKPLCVVTFKSEDMSWGKRWSSVLIRMITRCQEIDKETRRQCINDQNESERLDTGGKLDIVYPKSASGGWY